MDPSAMVAMADPVISRFVLPVELNLTGIPFDCERNVGTLPEGTGEGTGYLKHILKYLYFRCQTTTHSCRPVRWPIQLESRTNRLPDETIPLRAPATGS